MTTDLIKSIQKVVDEEINPVLDLHKGKCEIVDFFDGALTIRLLGGCVGCPSSKITLMNGVVPILTERFPDLIQGIYLDMKGNE